jgi:threonylcarbamoyladenosine tRNA methylthiotransferase CDKAL1
VFAATAAATVAALVRLRDTLIIEKIPHRRKSARPSKSRKEGAGNADELEDLAATAMLPDPSRESRRHTDVRQTRTKQHVAEDEDQTSASGNGDVLPGKQRVFVKTFGCAHNSADSEFMMGLLRDYGYTLADDLETADACVINSCTVKNPSQDGAVNLVRKAQGSGKSVVLAGCVPSSDAGLAESLEGVSMLSVTQIDRVVEVVEEGLRGNVVRLLGKNRPMPSLELPRVRRNSLIEIIPISGGCLGNCSYCKTKHARGKLSSYPESEIVARAVQAASEGVTEVWLASEDTGAYGIDLGTNIASLMLRIADALPPKVMLKLGMTNPPYMLAHIEGVAEVLRRPNVFEFIHVPVQSGSDQVLRAMVREYTSADFRRLVDALKAAVPDILVATDLICGFPAESEEDHQASMDLVDDYKFPVLNISQFYPRPGTPAAKLRKLPGDIVKKRSSAMTTLFESYSTWNALVGQEVRVWFSETNTKHNQTIGHTKGYAKVVVDHQETLLGHSALVRLERATKWHLEGRVVGGLT